MEGHIKQANFYSFIINRTFSNIIHATAELTPKVAEMHLVVCPYPTIPTFANDYRTFSEGTPDIPRAGSLLHNSSFQRYSPFSQALLDQQNSVDAAIVLWVVCYLSIFT